MQPCSHSNHVPSWLAGRPLLLPREAGSFIPLCANSLAGDLSGPYYLLDLGRRHSHSFEGLAGHSNAAFFLGLLDLCAALHHQLVHPLTRGMLLTRREPTQ